MSLVMYSKGRKNYVHATPNPKHLKASINGRTHYSEVYPSCRQHNRLQQSETRGPFKRSCLSIPPHPISEVPARQHFGGSSSWGAPPHCGQLAAFGLESPRLLVRDMRSKYWPKVLLTESNRGHCSMYQDGKPFRRKAVLDILRWVELTNRLPLGRVAPCSTQCLEGGFRSFEADLPFLSPSWNPEQNSPLWRRGQIDGKQQSPKTRRVWENGDQVEKHVPKHWRWEGRAFKVPLHNLSSLQPPTPKKN